MRRSTEKVSFMSSGTPTAANVGISLHTDTFGLLLICLYVVKMLISHYITPPSPFAITPSFTFHFLTHQNYHRCLIGSAITNLLLSPINPQQHTAQQVRLLGGMIGVFATRGMWLLLWVPTILISYFMKLK